MKINYNKKIIKIIVVKTTNNDYYMTHSFDKSYNSSGWAFMDYKNKKDFGIEVTENDNILTLSTCANDSRYRVVLHARKQK